ncbi:MAG: MFS transporter, partial [Anaerovoracaceae bacterium]
MAKEHKYTLETVNKNGMTLQVKRFPQLTSGQVAYATVIAFCAWSFSTFDFVLEGTLLPLMAQEFGWSVAYSAQVSMYVSIAVLLVSFTVGPVAEKIGRSNALLLCTLGTCLSSFISGFVTGAAFLVFARAFSAYGYQEQCVNATYMNEITTNVKHKGLVYGFVQGGWPIGVMLGAVICTLWLDDLGWRGMYWLATVPAIIIIILRIKLKESPRYLELKEVKKLIKEGKMAEAIALGAVYGIDVEKMVQKNTIGKLFEPGF